MRAPNTAPLWVRSAHRDPGLVHDGLLARLDLLSAGARARAHPGFLTPVAAAAGSARDAGWARGFSTLRRWPPLRAAVIRSMGASHPACKGHGSRALGVQLLALLAAAAHVPAASSSPGALISPGCSYEMQPPPVRAPAAPDPRLPDAPDRGDRKPLAGAAAGRSGRRG